MRAFFALFLAGCLFDPEPRVVHREYSLDPACLKEQPTTYTDSTEDRHFECRIDSFPDVQPPRAGK